ncbi:unnamed protein product [Pleuronectes platessa]|uniref:Uncharacterized protein n=1 Tax=Pleuronectes platessa TaxID=8262 RepID=A0A9N7TGD1_PLEPL|nr:unnamed protein product [Pleuronectes platessa]
MICIQGSGLFPSDSELLQRMNGFYMKERLFRFAVVAGLLGASRITSPSPPPPPPLHPLLHAQDRVACVRPRSKLVNGSILPAMWGCEGSRSLAGDEARWPDINSPILFSHNPELCNHLQDRSDTLPRRLAPEPFTAVTWSPRRRNRRHFHGILLPEPFTAIAKESQKPPWASCQAATHAKVASLCERRGRGERGASAERAAVGNEWHVTDPAAPHGSYMPKSAEPAER